jgi:hypothetical protein
VLEDIGRREELLFASVCFFLFFFISTYSAIRLTGEILGGNQACEEEGDDRGLHCEDVGIGSAGTKKRMKGFKTFFFFFPKDRGGGAQQGGDLRGGVLRRKKENW